MMANRTTARHSITFEVGQMVKFRGTGEGPFEVKEAIEIPDGPYVHADPEDMWPREAAGHHQHIVLEFDDSDGTGVSKHTYSGAWLEPA